MGDMLSQAEIDALLSGALSMDEEQEEKSRSDAEVLTPQEIDAIGEIGNISMGTSATTLYTLLGKKVTITTPRVSVTTWEELSEQYPEPYVAVKVQYIDGLIGTNLLIMRINDVKIITDLMMGGSGHVDGDAELSEMHLSAVSEAMNQMVGSAATSMSSMFEKRVEISPPESRLIHFAEDRENIKFEEKNDQIVKVAFSLTVGDLIDSQIMQLLPISFAKELVQNLLRANEKEEPLIPAEPQPAAPEPLQKQPERKSPAGDTPGFAAQPRQEPPRQDANRQMPYMTQPSYQSPINVQPAQFQSFDSGGQPFEVQNISLLMDVPLQITVELGRTTKKIKEILEFGQGSIIELDKLAGEPVDILVNGKNVAKGEVVVIDESFGVRITDIIHPSKRL
ncbi:MAG TPA: flagellar motor switch phosphatase FliY [Ruminiclostridium sp.]|nr:flagellar motor switch phosphatase FliY [Clostridiaceae bacterium]HAA25030.1 flagellar motor switch phosphatase FliY [Ruminiclostridium sp.]